MTTISLGASVELNSLEPGTLANDLLVIAVGALMFLGFAQLAKWRSKHQASGGSYSRSMAKASKLSVPIYLALSAALGMAFLARLAIALLGSS